jgi:hypothetical protein
MKRVKTMTKASEVTEVKPTVRREQAGMALEVDAIKKISHQLERVTDNRARVRILSFVQHYVHSANGAVAPIQTDGQGVGFPFEES